MDWDKAYRDHQPEVYRWLCGKSRNADLARDLTQDVFVRAMRGERNFRYDDGRGVVPWLMTIAHNTFVDHVKSARTQREIPVAEYPVDDLVASAETEALEALTNHALLRAVAGLNPLQRDAVVMHYWGRMQDKEIAEHTGTGDKAVKLVRYRARQNLHRTLAEVA